jgi:ABC-type phosphonate transport system ATPase subunit
MSLRDREPRQALNFYAKSRLVEVVRRIADQHDTSISEVVNDLLETALEQHHSDTLVLRRVRVLEESLPRYIIDPPDDHPVWGGKQPVDVVAEYSWNPGEYR